MTTGQQAAAGTQAVGREASRPTGGTGRAPVIVLTYGHAGAGRLQSLLSGHPELACTTGTGLLPACEQAAAAWREVEGRRNGSLSALAISSVRTLATGMITVVTARTGKRLWCETASADPGAAETFLTLFPGTRFVCLHRACPDVIYAAVKASPWGLSGQPFARYTVAHPASTVAALAAWWAAHAGPLLAFERDHPQACLRVRYEDLVVGPGETERSILTFLGLGEPGPSVPELPGDPGTPALPEADAPGCGADLPVGQLPPPLLAQVNELHVRLGYPTLDPDS